MIGMLLVSHGRMAEGMLDSLELIMGSCDQMHTVSLCAGEDFESFRAKVMEAIRQLDSGDGVLVFVDLYGASPFNASVYAAARMAQEGISVRVLAGMNLAMLLETAAMRVSSSLQELVAIAGAAGRDGISEPLVVKEEENGEDY